MTQFNGRPRASGLPARKAGHKLGEGLYGGCAGPAALLHGHPPIPGKSSTWDHSGAFHLGTCEPSASPAWLGQLWVSTAASQAAGGHKNMRCQRCQNITAQVHVVTSSSSRFSFSSPSPNMACIQMCNVGRAVRIWALLVCFS